MNAAIQQAAKRIGSLDATRFNDSIDQSRDEIVKLEAAINTAFERQAAIQNTLRDIRDQSLLRSNIGNDIANKLLAGDLEAATRPDTTLLEHELELLKDGVRELRRRIDAERQSISAQQQLLKREIGTAFDGLAEEFEAAAKQATSQLVDLYAASFVLTAIGQRSDLGVIQRKLARAMPGIAANGEQIDQRVSGFEVPAWIEPILEAVRRFNAPTANAAPRLVQMPN